MSAAASLSLAQWLALLERRHADRPIVLGLDRVQAVRARLGLNPACPVITVGGTNGKGSTCAFLEAMLQAAGHRVGCYTSPHLIDYRERVRIDGGLLSPERHAQAFAAVEAARGDTPLTYFEHGTLAAMWLFAQERLDALVLEVGMGGRLDAVNAFDPDCAVVTSVDLDHQQYLGPTREAIGREKAGIFRPSRPAVVTDPDPPASLVAHAHDLGARLLRLGREIRIEAGDGGWTCRVGDQVYVDLPQPSLAGVFQLHNAAAAIAALTALRPRLTVSIDAVRTGLAQATLPGRFQVVTRRPLIVLDVAHNPQAARALADNLAHLPAARRIAVLGVLADKDAAGIAQALAGRIDAWHLAGLAGPRGLAGTELAARLQPLGLPIAAVHADVAHALAAARDSAGPADIIVVFGSFHTVAEANQALQHGAH
ncbi:MAG: bifunctional tetrahydrofolate synthase/dihydrofolate synthase [Thiobacillaceae bacterium]|nr:bifunctional tetrahydrofolate synthase/dihydrofolate synthase [Thiobacillaceae bacterium]MCX7673387.1 bifunctional tetrahydrofolate synthase/dihydrofolate synthase [Thiobacillaceae bacterium]MDW8323151.1 bifunctional tetrahydrofolate synthase/dihydrofolate synthase [Burkholderiales bacterium]